MAPILLLSLLLGASPESPWQALRLSIEKDRYTSSDTVTLCRVRVENPTGRTWPGRILQFEALAFQGGIPMERERGRFGLSLKPYDSLETLVAFAGQYDRFEVHPLTSTSRQEVQKPSRGGRGRSKSKAGKRKTGDGRRKRKR